MENCYGIFHPSLLLVEAKRAPNLLPGYNLTLLAILLAVNFSIVPYSCTDSQSIYTFNIASDASAPYLTVPLSELLLS